MTKTLHDVAKDIGVTLPAGLIGWQKRAARVGAKVMQAEVRVQLATAGAENGRLSGVGKNGAAIGTRVIPLPSSAIVQATGPFHLIEESTSAHVIGGAAAQEFAGALAVLSALAGSGAARQSRAKKRTKPLRLGDDVVRATVHHPGTKGKHPFAKAAVAARPAVVAAMDLELARTIGTALR